MINLLLLVNLAILPCETHLQDYRNKFRELYTHHTYATSDKLMAVFGFTSNNRLREQAIFIRQDVPMFLPNGAMAYYKGDCTTTHPLATEIWGKTLRIYEVHYPDGRTDI